MRVRPLLLALLAALVVSSVAAFAAPSAQARTFYLDSSSFYPNYAYEGSGVQVEFMNTDSVPHHIVSYSVYGSEAWSLDITLAPWETYMVPRPFYCVYPGCGWSATYLFRDADRSRVAVGWGYSYCSGYCGELEVHR